MIPETNVFRKQKLKKNHQDHIQQTNQFKIEMHKMDVQILKQEVKILKEVKYAQTEENRLASEQIDKI